MQIILIHIIIEWKRWSDGLAFDKLVKFKLGSIQNRQIDIWSQLCCNINVQHQQTSDEDDKISKETHNSSLIEISNLHQPLLWAKDSPTYKNACLEC